MQNDLESDILRLAVVSSPFSSDMEFKATLQKRLVGAITGDTTDGEMRKQAILGFCVLCATGELISITKR
jgi:hypothetical protein